MSAALSGHVALVFVQLCFGLLPLFGKWAFAEFEPRAVAVWRIGATAVVFLVLALALYGRRGIPAGRDLLWLGACALMGVVCNQVLFLEGLARTTTVNAGLMMLLIPVLTFGLAVVSRQERFSRARGLGIAIAFAGTAQLILQREADMSRPYLVGNLLIAANALCFSVYLVASRPLARRYPPLVLIAWVFVLASFTIPAFASDAPLAPPSAGSREWMSLAAIILFATILGYLLNAFALARVAASTTAFYVFAQPLVTAVAGVVVLGESLRPQTMMAGAAIFAGIWFVLGCPRPGRRRAAGALPRRCGTR